MKKSALEPEFKYSEEDVEKKSKLAKAFLNDRSRLNNVVAAADNRFLKRFYNLDHNAYLNGALNAKTKELMGLVGSAVLRCDDCIYYHIIQSYRLEASRAEVEESLNIAAVIGGTIVVPHLRRAYDLLSELYGNEAQD